MSKKRRSYDVLAMLFFFLAFIIFIAGIVCACTLTTEIVQTSSKYITRTQVNNSLVAIYLCSGTFGGLICLALGVLLHRTYLLCRDIKNQW